MRLTVEEGRVLGGRGRLGSGEILLQFARSCNLVEDPDLSSTLPIRGEKRVEETLARLRAGVRQRQGEVAALTEGGRRPAASVDLLTRSRVEEPVAMSSLLLFGRLVIFARKAAFHLFVKWWVRPVLQRQNGFNQLVARRLVHQGEREAHLRQRLEELEGRIEELESRRE